jgi:hypothetical protein
MQSSESVYGVANQAGHSESIKSGISFLEQAIEKSNKEKCDIWTAIQAYNFGLAYIDYVAKNGRKNTIELAEKYSLEVVAPSLGNTTGEKYRYLQPFAIKYNGGYLYKNGGNYFYADIVRFNWHLVSWIK